MIDFKMAPMLRISFCIFAFFSFSSAYAARKCTASLAELVTTLKRRHDHIGSARTLRQRSAVRARYLAELKATVEKLDDHEIVGDVETKKLIDFLRSRLNREGESLDLEELTYLNQKAFQFWVYRKGKQLKGFADDSLEVTQAWLARNLPTFYKAGSFVGAHAKSLLSSIQNLWNLRRKAYRNKIDPEVLEIILAKEETIIRSKVAKFFELLKSRILTRGPVNHVFRSFIPVPGAQLIPFSREAFLFERQFHMPRRFRWDNLSEKDKTHLRDKGHDEAYKELDEEISANPKSHMTNKTLSYLYQGLLISLWGNVATTYFSLEETVDKEEFAKEYGVLESNQVQILVNMVPHPHLAVRVNNRVYNFGISQMTASSTVEYMMPYSEAYKKISEEAAAMKRDQLRNELPVFNPACLQFDGLIPTLKQESSIAFSENIANPLVDFLGPYSVMSVVIEEDEEKVQSFAKDLEDLHNSFYMNRTGVNDCATMPLRLARKNGLLDDVFWGMSDTLPGGVINKLVSLRNSGDERIVDLKTIVFEDEDRDGFHRLRNSYINNVEQQVMYHPLVMGLNLIDRMKLESNVDDEDLTFRSERDGESLKKIENDSYAKSLESYFHNDDIRLIFQYLNRSELNAEQVEWLVTNFTDAHDRELSARETQLHNQRVDITLRSRIEGEVRALASLKERFYEKIFEHSQSGDIQEKSQ